MQVNREHRDVTVPAHFLPSAIVFLDRMPMATKGKVVDTALPDPPPRAPSRAGRTSLRTARPSGAWPGCGSSG